MEGERHDAKRQGEADGERILKLQASLTAHWHDKGADWRGLAHTQAHQKKNTNWLPTAARHPIAASVADLGILTCL